MPALLLALALPASAAALRAVPAVPAALAAPALSPATPSIFTRPGLYEVRGAGVLVVDLKGSTALHQAVGNRQARLMADAVLDYAEATAALFDGVTARRLGDGQLLAFPSMTKALEAAAQIQARLDDWRRRHRAPGVELRMGVHGGRLLVDGSEPDVYGQAAGRALELADLSQGGEIALDHGSAMHPALKRLARDNPLVPGEKALLLRPLARHTKDPLPGLQPTISASEFTRAGTLFAELHGGAGAYERLGRKAAYALLADFQGRARAAVESAGGIVVKTPGESVMASFPTAAAALRAALALRELSRGLHAVKLGVNYGRVQRQDRLDSFDYYGNTVNAAARMMRLAKPGEIVAGDSLASDPEAGPLLAGAERLLVSFKGFREPLPVRRLR